MPSISAPWEQFGRQLGAGQGAFEEGQSRMGKALADELRAQSAARSAESTAALNATKADEIKRRAKYQTPEFATQIAGALAGITTPQAEELDRHQRLGDWGPTDPNWSVPLQYEPKATPDWATPQVMNRFNAARGAHLLNISGTGDSKADDTTKAFAKVLGLSGMDEAEAQRVGMGVAATDGKPLYHQGQNGTMQLFTGVENINDVGRSVERENNSQAGNADAMAALHREQIPKVREETKLIRSKIGQPQYAIGADGRPVAISAPNLGKAPPGYRWKADGSLEPIPGGPVDRKANPPQKIEDAKDVLALLDMAEPIIDESTGSYLGVGADLAARAFGQSTTGAEAAAQLKALEGSLVSKMPKMSGPQSDKDVLLYKQMAGQVGDPTIPAAQKRKAMATIRAINERYANIKPSGASAPDGDGPKNADERRASVLKARQAIKDGYSKAEVVRYLEASGITDHGIK